MITGGIEYKPYNSHEHTVHGMSEFLHVTNTFLISFTDNNLTCTLCHSSGAIQEHCDRRLQTYHMEISTCMQEGLQQKPCI